MMRMKLSRVHAMFKEDDDVDDDDGTLMLLRFHSLIHACSRLHVECMVEQFFRLQFVRF